MSHPLKDSLVDAVSHAYLSGFIQNGIGPEIEEAMKLGRKTKLRAYLREQGIDVAEQRIAEIIEAFRYEALEDFK